MKKVSLSYKPNFIRLLFVVMLGTVCNGKNFAQSKETTSQDTLKYATINLYRPVHRAMRLNKYVVHFGDKTFTARNGSKTSIQIFSEGDLEIWAKTEKKRVVIVPVKFGETYYVKCEVEAGILRVNAIFCLVDNVCGRNEFVEIK